MVIARDPMALFLSLLLLPVVYGQDWPGFRGPGGDGQAQATGLPLSWSETENVSWKTEIPLRGWSTPVILDGQVWLTTATPDGHDFFVLCLDAGTGAVRVNERLFHTDSPEPLGNPVNGYASPSPAIEPGRVYVHFGSYGTACLDTATAKVLWQRQDLPCRHYRGPGSSLVLAGELLIVTMDGVDVQYTAALDKGTGKTVWRTDRTTDWGDLDENGQPQREGDFRKAYNTPLVVARGPGVAPQLISVGSRAAYGYDLATGRELWKVGFRGFSTAPSPVWAQDLAFITTGQGHTELWAVRTDGEGEVTGSHVAWRYGHDVPLTPSPLVVDGLLYMVSDSGTATCLEATSGALVWSARVPGNYAASPVLADGRLYFCSQQGKTSVVKPGRSFELLATNVLDTGCMASPAVAGEALYLRTKTHLYRLAAGGAK
jgi:outer membrane protein assembly factor BamB